MPKYWAPAQRLGRPSQFLTMSLGQRVAPPAPVDRAPAGEESADEERDEKEQRRGRRGLARRVGRLLRLGFGLLRLGEGIVHPLFRLLLRDAGALGDDLRHIARVLLRQL